MIVPSMWGEEVADTTTARHLVAFEAGKVPLRPQDHPLQWSPYFGLPLASAWPFLLWVPPPFFPSSIVSVAPGFCACWTPEHDEFTASSPLPGPLVPVSTGRRSQGSVRFCQQQGQR